MWFRELTKPFVSQGVRIEQSTGMQNEENFKEFAMHSNELMWTSSSLLQGSWLQLDAI